MFVDLSWLSTITNRCLVKKDGYTIPWLTTINIICLWTSSVLPQSSANVLDFSSLTTIISRCFRLSLTYHNHLQMFLTSSDLPQSLSDVCRYTLAYHNHQQMFLTSSDLPQPSADVLTSSDLPESSADVFDFLWLTTIINNCFELPTYHNPQQMFLLCLLLLFL